MSQGSQTYTYTFLDIYRRCKLICGNAFLFAQFFPWQHLGPGAPHGRGLWRGLWRGLGVRRPSVLRVDRTPSMGLWEVYGHMVFECDENMRSTTLIYMCIYKNVCSISNQHCENKHGSTNSAHRPRGLPKPQIPVHYIIRYVLDVGHTMNLLHRVNLRSRVMNLRFSMVFP